MVTKSLKRTAMATAAASALAIGLGAASANAAILLDNWTLDLTGKDGLGSTVINNIDKISYTGIFDYKVDGISFPTGIGTPTNGNGTAEVGEQFRVNGLQASTAFINDDTGIIPSNLNGLNDYELTFEFDVNGTFISKDTVSSTLTFTHTGPQTTASGLLKVYVDNLAVAEGGEASRAVNGSATSYTTDGGAEHIATFAILPEDGGSLTPLSLDGSDDASFVATFLASGVWFDKDGNDLANAGGDPLGSTIAITTSTLDIDPDNDGVINTSYGAFASCGTTEEATCGSENGDVRLASSIPEPTSMALLGFGLLGAAGAARRRRQRKA